MPGNQGLVGGNGINCLIIGAEREVESRRGVGVVAAHRRSSGQIPEDQLPGVVAGSEPTAVFADIKRPDAAIMAHETANLFSCLAIPLHNPICFLVRLKEERQDEREGTVA